MKLKTFVLPVLACVAAFGMMLLTGCGETTPETTTIPSTNEMTMPPTNMPPVNP